MPCTQAMGPSLVQRIVLALATCCRCLSTNPLGCNYTGDAATGDHGRCTACWTDAVGANPSGSAHEMVCAGDGMCCSSPECLSGSLQWPAHSHGVATLALRRPASASEGCLGLSFQVLPRVQDRSWEVLLGFGARAETTPLDKDWVQVEQMAAWNGTQTIDSLVRVMFLRVKLGNATRGSFSPPSGAGQLRWNWTPAGSGTCVAPTFVAKDTEAVVFAIAVYGAMLVWVVIVLSLCGVLQQDNLGPDTRRGNEAVRNKPPQQGHRGLRGLASRSQGTATGETTANGAEVAAARPPRRRSRTVSAWSTIRLSFMTDEGDEHLQSYESELALARAKASRRATVLSADEREQWRRNFLRGGDPFSWWLRVWQLPLRGTCDAGHEGVREIAGVKAVLYLEFLAALARILSGCCVCVAAYVPFVLMTADACPTASDSGHGLLPGQFGRADTLCLVSAANIADRDALRLWFCCLMCLCFALFTWWTSIRTIRRQTVSFACCSARKKPSNPSSRGLPVEEMDVGPEHVPLYTLMILANLSCGRGSSGDNTDAASFRKQLLNLFQDTIGPEALLDLQLVAPAPRRWCNCLRPRAVTAFLTFNDPMIPYQLAASHMERYGGRARCTRLCCCCRHRVERNPYAPASDGDRTMLEPDPEPEPEPEPEPALTSAGCAIQEVSIEVDAEETAGLVGAPAEAPHTRVLACTIVANLKAFCSTARSELFTSPALLSREAFAHRVWDTADASAANMHGSNIGSVCARTHSDWDLMAGPNANDIVWASLGSTSCSRRARRCLVFVLLLSVSLLLAFPATNAAYMGRVLNLALQILNSDVKVAESYEASQGLDGSLFGSPVHTLDAECGFWCSGLSETLPTLASLLSNTVVLPLLVEEVFVPQEGWLLKTQQFRSVLRKTAALLFCVILVFPTLAMVSQELWVEGVTRYMLDMMKTLDSGAAETLGLCAAHTEATWELFSKQLVQPLVTARRSLGGTLTQNGGNFFLLYILESSFLTNAAALALLPARFFRLLSWTTAKAAACCDRTCKSKCCPEFPKWQFPLEYHVATACVMFAVVLTYSIASPLIVVVGLLYILLKATADRYVLLFGEDADLDERFSQEYDSFALYSSADTIILVAIFVMLLSNLQFVMEKQGPEGCVFLLGLGVAVASTELCRRGCCESHRKWSAQDPDEVLPRSLAALSTEEATKALGIREVGGLGYYSPPKGEGAEAGCAVREGGRKRHYAVVGLHG